MRLRARRDLHIYLSLLIRAQVYGESVAVKNKLVLGY